MKDLALDEQETNFTVEATDRNVINIFSNDSVWIKRLEALNISPYRVDGCGRFYKVSLDDFNFGIYRRRQLSDDVRAAMAERLKAVRLDSTGIETA